jgi:hypothetical protein
METRAVEPDQIVDQGPRPAAKGDYFAASPPSYIVAEGDRLAAIAARLGVDPAVLLDSDGQPLHGPSLRASREVRAGEILRAGLPDDVVDDDGEEAELPTPHPAFLRAFPSPFYMDEADEFAPFGSDEGWDVRWSILVEGPPLGTDTELGRLLADVLDEEGAALALDGSDEDTAAELDPALIGAAFALLWATGRIDDAGREQLLAAIDRQIARYGDDPRLTGMRADVAALEG